jgi:transcriptional regulator GlxA family with amidase domain
MGHSSFTELVFGFIVSNYMEAIDMELLERECGVSRFMISRRFRQIYGLSPMRWLWMYRVLMAGRMLSSQSQLRCEDVALTCGFQTVAHFNRVFKRILGRSPAHYRDNPMDSKAMQHVMSLMGFRPCSLPS